MTKFVKKYLNIIIAVTFVICILAILALIIFQSVFSVSMFQHSNRPDQDFTYCCGEVCGKNIKAESLSAPEEDFNMQELVLKADKTFLYVAGKEEDKSITITPQLNGAQLNPFNLNFNVDQGEAFDGEQSTLTDFDFDNSKNSDGVLKLSLNKKLTADIFNKVYGKSQAVNVSAIYITDDYSELFAEITFTVMAVREKITVNLNDKQYSADESAKTTTTSSLILKRGEITELSFSYPASASESIKLPANGIVELSERNEKVFDGLKNISFKLSAMKTGEDTIFISCGDLTVQVPVIVKESDKIAVPEFSADLIYSKVDGDTLITSRKDIFFYELFNNLNLENGVLNYNDLFQNSQKQIKINCTKNGENFSLNESLSAGKYVFEFVLPYGAGVDWANGTGNAVKKTAVLGAPIIKVTKKTTSVEYNGAEHVWSEFIDVLAEGASDSLDELVTVKSTKMLDAGFFVFSIRLKNEEAFLLYENSLTDGSAEIQAEILKASVNLTVNASGIYNGKRQELYGESVAAEFFDDIARAQLSAEDLTFVAGPNVVNAGQYSFVLDDETASENSVRVNLVHKNFKLASVNGTFTVTPALISAAAKFSTVEYDGKDHFAQATEVEFEGLVPGDTFKNNTDYTISIHNGNGEVDRVEQAGKYFAKLDLLNFNYIFESKTKSAAFQYEITPKPVSLNIYTPQQTYNGKNLVPEANTGVSVFFDGVVIGDSLTASDISFAGTAVNAGIYYFTEKPDTFDSTYITVSLNSNVENYFLSKADGMFEIKPKNIGVTLSGKTVYNGRAVDFSSAEIMLSLDEKDYEYAELFGLNAISLTPQTEIKNFKNFGYTFGISDFSDIKAELKKEYSNNFSLTDVGGVFFIEKAPVTIVGNFDGSVEYGAPLNFSAQLEEFNGLSADLDASADITVWLSYELPSNMIGKYSFKTLSLKAELEGENSFNYEVILHVDSFSIEILKARLYIGNTEDNLKFCYVDSDGAEKPIDENFRTEYNGCSRTVLAYGHTKYESKVLMAVSGGAEFCGAGKYTVTAVNPDKNLYEYTGKDEVTFQVERRKISVELTASAEYEGTEILPSLDNCLNVEFINVVNSDCLSISDLNFNGSAINAGVYSVGVNGADITVELKDNILNYLIVKAEGYFEILPSLIIASGSAEKSVLYTGENIETTLAGLTNGISIQDYAADDGVLIEFYLKTSAIQTGIYSFPYLSDGALQISYSVSVPQEKSCNYVKKSDGGYALDYSGAAFTVNVVMAEIVEINWYMETAGKVLPAADEVNMIFDADIYKVFAEGKFMDENGELRVLNKNELSVTLIGASEIDSKKLVFDGGSFGIRNTGCYFAILSSDIYLIKDGLERIKINVSPYVITVKGHTAEAGGDLLYGDYVLPSVDGGEVKLGSGASKEIVHVLYNLDATYAYGGASLNKDGFVDANTYYNLIPSNVQLVSDSPKFDSGNYEYICSEEYSLKIAPIAVMPISEGNFFAEYIGYRGSLNGGYTEKKIATDIVRLKISPVQSVNLPVKSEMLPSFKLKFLSGNFINNNGTQAAVNAGKYQLLISLLSSNFIFSDSMTIETSVSFIINRADLNVRLDKTEGIYNAIDHSGKIKINISLTDSTDITQYFYNEDGSVISLDGNGIFGSKAGVQAFKLKFFSDSKFLIASECDKLINVGAYYAQLEFAQNVCDNFNVRKPDLPYVTYEIKPSEVILDADNLNLTENSELMIALPEIYEYLTYDKKIKTILITNERNTAGIFNGSYVIPICNIFGKLEGFYNDAILYIRLSTPSEAAAVYSIEPQTVSLSNYAVSCSVQSALIQIFPKATEVEWRCDNGNITDNSVKFTYNGLDRISGFSVRAEGVDGEEVKLSNPSSSLRVEGNEFLVDELLNAGTYALSVKSQNTNYELINSVIQVEILPYTVTCEIMRDVWVWRNAAKNNALLQNGKYDVKGIHNTVSAVNSFVGYKDGVINNVIMGSPSVLGQPMFDVKYSGNTASELGGYVLQAVLSLTKVKSYGLELVNFKWEDGLYSNLRGGESAEDYGEAIAYNEEDNTLIITKAWYIVILNNGLENQLKLPENDKNGDGIFNVDDGDYYGWTFGCEPYISEYPLPVRANAEMYISIGGISGSSQTGRPQISKIQWQNEYEFARLNINFTNGTKDDSCGKIKSFIDFWLNSATPSGEYLLIAYIAEEESGGEIYPSFTYFYSIYVLPSPIKFEANGLENFNVEYDGQLHFFNQNMPPVFDNMSGEEIELLRSGTGWEKSFISRPFGNSEINLDELYGKAGNSYEQPKILFNDSASGEYHDISDKSDSWNNVNTNINLPIRVKKSGLKVEPYIIYYKIRLHNYSEYITDNGSQLTQESSFYKVEITPRNLLICAENDEFITVSGTDISWQYGTVDTLKFMALGKIAVGGLLGSDIVSFGYKFVPMANSGTADSYKEIPTVGCNEYGEEIEIPISVIKSPGVYNLYIFLNNYDDKYNPNQNYSVGAEDSNVKCFRIEIVRREVGAYPQKFGYLPLPEDMLAENGLAVVYSGEPARYSLDIDFEKYFKVYYDDKGSVESPFINSGVYKIFLCFTEEAGLIYKWPEKAETGEVTDGKEKFEGLIRKLEVIPRGLYLVLETWDSAIESVYDESPQYIKTSFKIKNGNEFFDITDKIQDECKVEYLRNGKLSEPIDAGDYYFSASLIDKKEDGIYAAENYFFKGILNSSGSYIDGWRLNSENTSVLCPYKINAAKLNVLKTELDHIHIFNGSDYAAEDPFSTHFDIVRADGKELKNFEEGVAFSVFYQREGERAEKLIHAGEYRICLIISERYANNYTFYTDDGETVKEIIIGTFTILKAQAEIRADDYITEYDGFAHSICAPSVQEWVNPDGIIITYNGFEKLPVNAGTYLVEITVTPTPDYEGATVESTLIIQKKAVKINWLSESYFVYDGSEKTPYLGLSCREIPPELISIKYFTNDGTYCINAPSEEGAYLVCISFNDASNYVFIGPLSKTFYIRSVPEASKCVNKNILCWVVVSGAIVVELGKTFIIIRRRSKNRR